MPLMWASRAGRRVTVSAVCTLALAVSAGGVAATPSDAPGLTLSATQEPEPVIPGTPEEQLQAWNDLPEAQRQEALDFVRDHIVPMAQAQANALPPEEPMRSSSSLSGRSA